MTKRRFSPATVVAGLALFFALGGSAIAAHRFLLTSTSQVKPSVLSALRGRRGATGAPGPAGPIGPIGVSGPPGPPGPSSTTALREVLGADNVMPTKSQLGAESEAEGIEGSFAVCPVGERVVSGGSNVFTGHAGAIAAELSTASEAREAWIVIAANGGNEQGEIEAIAYCAKDGGAITAAARPGARGGRVRAEEKRLMASFARRLKRPR